LILPWRILAIFGISVFFYSDIFFHKSDVNRDGLLQNVGFLLFRVGILKEFVRPA